MSSNSKNAGAIGHPPGKPVRCAHPNQLRTNARKRGQPSSAAIDGCTTCSFANSAICASSSICTSSLERKCANSPLFRHADLIREDAEGYTVEA
jgi:hypothetical protein